MQPDDSLFCNMALLVFPRPFGAPSKNALHLPNLVNSHCEAEQPALYMALVLNNNLQHAARSAARQTSVLDCASWEQQARRRCSEWIRTMLARVAGKFPASSRPQTERQVYRRCSSSDQTL